MHDNLRNTLLTWFLFFLSSEHQILLESRPSEDFHRTYRVPLAESATHLPSGGLTQNMFCLMAPGGSGCGISIRRHFTLGQKDNGPNGDGSNNVSLLPQQIRKTPGTEVRNAIIILSEMHLFHTKTHFELDLLINRPAEASKEENKRNVICDCLVHSGVLTPQDRHWCGWRERGFLSRILLTTSQSETKATVRGC